MDLELFHKLCYQRAKGEKTEMEFLEEMRCAFERKEEDSPHMDWEKEVLLYLYERLIEVLEKHEPSEKEILAREAEEWLSCPTLRY